MTSSDHQPRALEEAGAMAMTNTGEGVKLTKADHPLTPFLMNADGYVPKRYVEKMSGAWRYLRPFWRTSWGCWCVTDGGPQQVFRKANGDFTVKDPEAGRSAISSRTKGG